MKHTTADEIIFELYKTLEILGAKSDLLAVVGSYKDTMSSNEILSDIKVWNESQGTENDENVQCGACGERIDPNEIYWFGGISYCQPCADAAG